MDRMTQDESMYEPVANASAPRETHRGAGLESLNGQVDPEHQQASQERMAWLVKTIETEIIPRLMMAHQTSASASLPACEPTVALGPAEVIAFGKIVLGSDPGAAATHVNHLREVGVPLDGLYLDLLSPTARYLGKLWEEDQCDFTAVTLGLWRLQQLIYDLSPAFQSETEYSVQQRRAMLVAAPGSQHTLGLVMVGEFFRRAGWDVWGEPLGTPTQWMEAVRTDWFDVIGFSVGTEAHIPGLSSLILALRKASRNPSVGVLLGGPLMAIHPEYVSIVGADATAFDAPSAIAQAENLLAQRSRQC